VASVVTAIPWVAALFGTWLIPRYSDRTGERRNIAAFTLLAAAIGIAVSGLVSPVLAIIALCVAAVGVIAVQPVFWTMPTQLLSGTALAAGIGFVNLFGAIGGFLAPIIRSGRNDVRQFCRIVDARLRGDCRGGYYLFTARESHGAAGWQRTALM
jgi:nitrate/nitrite transporter NarK